MQDQHERAVAIPSSYGAPGSGPGVPDINDTIESENLNAPAPNAGKARPGFDDAHDTPEESA